MSDQCLNCGGLIMEPGKTCYCPELPGTGYRRRASDVSIQVERETLERLADQVDVQWAARDSSWIQARIRNIAKDTIQVTQVPEREVREGCTGAPTAVGAGLTDIGLPCPESPASSKDSYTSHADTAYEIVAKIGNIANRPDLRAVQSEQRRMIREALAKAQAYGRLEEMMKQSTAKQREVTSKATNPEEHARGCEYDGATWKCASRCPVRAAMIAPTQTAEQYTQLLRELDDLLDFLAKEVITLDIVESDKNNGQWPRSDLVKHAREDIAKALQAPTDTERPKCPCGAWYWDEHTMACAIRVSAVATAPAVEKAKYRIRLLEDDNLLLRSRIAEACLHCSPGSVVWEILNPREESRPDRKGTE
jgi:hypothetical protein